MGTMSVLAVLAFALLLGWAASRRVLWAAQGSRAPHRVLLGACALSLVWAAGLSALAWAPRLPLGAGLPVVDALRQVAWMGLTLLLLGVDLPRRNGPGFARPVMAVAVLAALWLASSGLPGLWSRDERPLVQAGAGLALALCGLVLVEQLYRNAGDDRRWNAKPLCLGLAVGLLFDVYLSAEALLWRDPDAIGWQLRSAVAALGVPLLVLGLGRGAGLLANVQLSRQLVFHSATLLLSGLYLLLVSLLGYWVRLTGGEWGQALQLLLLAGALLALAVLVFSGALRAKLRVWLNKTFFRYRYDYRDEWLRFTEALAAPGGPALLGETVVRSLAGLVESPGGALWWRSSADDALRRGAAWNFDRGEAPWVPSAELQQAQTATRWIVDLNEFRSGRRDGPPPPDWLLAEPSAWLMLPLVADGRWHGCVVLAQPRTPITLDWEVRDLLKTAASQAAGTLALVQASDALLEAQKFEAFNRMSAFVVHDLKNIVTQLSLMMKNAQRLGDNPAFRADMHDTINHAVEKMRQLMLQLREGERPTGVSSGVLLNAVIERLRTSAAQRGRELRLHMPARVETRGVEARIERVLGHAVQNAFDASAGDLAVDVHLDAVGSSARVRVVDQGIGMTPEFVRERLFKPFQSSKAQGMGIGAFESLQYVRELGGQIDVDSRPGQGTTLTFLLPLFHSHS